LDISTKALYNLIGPQKSPDLKPAMIAPGLSVEASVADNPVDKDKQIAYEFEQKLFGWINEMGYTED
jgi:hypothetical protein